MVGYIRDQFYARSALWNEICQK